MPYADANGQRIYFTDTGGDGPAVLFSHGFFMDHEMWAPQLAALGDRYRSVTWDERCWGQTEQTDEAFDYWDLADDACALLDHLGIDQAVWCGMSQGGFLSLRAALAHPDRVRALVLVDTSPTEEAPDGRVVYEGMFDQALSTGLDPDLTAGIAGFLFGPDFDSTNWKGKWVSKPASAIQRAFDCLTGRDDISDRLGEITCPTLVFHGEVDAAFPLADAEGWVPRLGGPNELVRVPGAGHSSNLEDPETVNAALVAFLDGLG